MKIHEYQAKELMASYGVKTLEGHYCSNLKEAVQAAGMVGFPCVVKAQVHAGGRGKGGGVKLAKNLNEAKAHAESILGMTLVTPQTGPEGQLVNAVLVESGCDIARELYLGMVVDRESQSVCVMASQEGGVEIEEVASKTPEKILKVWLDPVTGLMPYQARQLAGGLELSPIAAKQFWKFINGLCRLFVEKDASLAEINPLVITGADDVVALDAKIDFDDNAIFRHSDLAGLRDPSQEDPREVQAGQHDLSYIALDGSIGCMVNGAGLAMATMDIIKHVGGNPANFLDVGGSATQEKVTEALKIILQDDAVKAVLVNIFGGIAKCDVIASGVVEAVKELGLKVPLVVRLEGTNVEKGKKILADSDVDIIAATSLLDAAEKAVRAAS